jgi:predicted dehydrogenase/threonine dehydrogenase-like Zn-dependent dehydrogenase
MKQIIQSLKDGSTSLVDVPVPKAGSGKILIRTTRSLVSVGTERMLVNFGRSNLISKAKQQPERVRQVFEKITSDGLLPTIQSVRQRLDEPLPLGYCNVGRVVEIGNGVYGYAIGDRVASNGFHAEYVSVPVNLATKIPDSISDEEASFTVVGAVALQGIRLCNPLFGETIVVIGLGLIGQITAQLLQANGCLVVGIDPDENKLKMASDKGIITLNPEAGADQIDFVNRFTRDTGADGVIITASASTDRIISNAARMSRKRGRIILVGVVGLNINRSDFYEKELTFQVSCSYGPGRYDENYEQKGIDYPLPYVRWTEKRNFEAVLNAIKTGKLEVKSLISERVPFNEYGRIYDKIATTKSVASILVYDEESEHSYEQRINRVLSLDDGSYKGSKGVIGIIGAGNFTKMTMLPALKNSSAHLKYIASAGGVSAADLGRKFGFSNITTDYKQILDDPEVDLILISTRHNLHASMTIECLRAGKHVFVEKPLAINDKELDDLISVYSEVSESADLTVSVGFNRRFSPHIRKIKTLIGDRPVPMNITATMNAGPVPQSSWIQDFETSGGRIIGEACHHIDLLIYLTGSRIVSVCLNAMGENPTSNTDNASILLRFENGSNGIINYFANGSKSYSKERIEVYFGGRTIIMDNFRRTEAFGFKGFRKFKTRINKGHTEQFNILISRMKNGGNALIPFSEIVNTTRATFAAIRSLHTGDWVDIY